VEEARCAMPKQVDASGEEETQGLLARTIDGDLEAASKHDAHDRNEAAHGGWGYPFLFFNMSFDVTLTSSKYLVT
jgi:hypothetical protein